MKWQKGVGVKDHHMTICCHASSPQALAIAVASPSSQSCSHMTELELREVKQLAQGPSVSNRQSRDSDVRRNGWVLSSCSSHHSLSPILSISKGDRLHVGN